MMIVKVLRKWEGRMGHKWMDINEYSRLFQVSISTIRRRIKRGALETKQEKGKYLIKVLGDQLPEGFPEGEQGGELEKKIRLLQEEVQELKMLVNIYEKKGLGVGAVGPTDRPPQ